MISEGETREKLTCRASRSAVRANFGGQGGGRAEVQPAATRWTRLRRPPKHTRVTRNLGNTGPSPVYARERSTLHERVVVPNPQHLLLTLSIETSLYEEKCPL